MTQVVDLDEVEMILVPYQICVLIGPFKHTLELRTDGACQLCCGGPHYHRDSLLVPIDPDPDDLLLHALRSRYGTPENVLGTLQCLQIPFHVDKCIWFMAAVMGHGREVNQRANTSQRAIEIVILRAVQM